MCKDQESIQSSTTPDPGYQWESDKLTVETTNESQEVSPFPAGDHKAQKKIGSFVYLAIPFRLERQIEHRQKKWRTR